MGNVNYLYPPSDPGMGGGLTLAQVNARIQSRVAPVEEDVEDIKSGRVGFTWYHAYHSTQDFTGAIFEQSFGVEESEFDDITFSEFTLTTMFDAFALPLNEPDFQILGIGFFSSDILSSGYRRQEEPIYIFDEPYKLFKSRYYIHTAYSGDLLNLNLLHRLHRYSRYVAISDDTSVNTANENRVKSYGPVQSLPDFGGIDKYVWFFVPTVAIVPTTVALAIEGSSNIFSDFVKQGSQFDIDGTRYYVYRSINKLAHGDYSGNDIYILPEHDDINYFVPPTIYPDADVGFDWYAGFYAANIEPELNPIDAALVLTGEVSSSEQITMPTDADGGVYDPDYPGRPGSRVIWVRYIAQPEAQPEPTSAFIVPDFSYATLEELEATGVWSSYWQEQPNNPIVINGVNHNVYLNRQSSNTHSTGGRSGEQLYIGRS